MLYLRLLNPAFYQKSAEDQADKIISILLPEKRKQLLRGKTAT